MLDARLRPAIDAILNPIGASLHRRGVTATQVTSIGFGLGIGAAVAVASGAFTWAIVLIALNRICDGLDGAVARQAGPTDFGGYLDIVLDFIFYSTIPFAFCLYAPENGQASAFLILSFIGTGVSFLAYAIVAEKRGISTEIRGKKSFYYLGGLTEGAETIIFLFVVCFWPAHFAYFAWGFGALCWVTTTTRIHAAASLH